MLEKHISQIKSLCVGIKSNFIKIGSHLKEIRDKQTFLEKHNSFNEFLKSNDFDFSRQHAYKFIKVYETFGHVAQCDTIPLNKLIQLTHVPDKELREELCQAYIEAEASQKPVNPPNLRDFQKKVRRVASRTDDALETDSDSLRDKCLRLINSYLEDLQAFKSVKADLQIRLRKILELIDKFPDDEELKKLKKEIENQV